MADCSKLFILVDIDEKTREKGCSQYWNGEPELAPEIWSVMPGGKYDISYSQSKIGWTLDENKQTDYVYCTFHKSDTDQVFLLPFLLYRMAFNQKVNEWKATYRTAIQDSGYWESKCVFVPASIVIESIKDEMLAYKKLRQLELF